MTDSTRDRIVTSADRLFYEGGYERTSFAVIADEIGISRGNFHYHFKAKDDILSAVIERRRNDTEAMLDNWQTVGADPVERISHFIDLFVTNRDDILRYGCPVGSLCSELAKADHPHLDRSGSIFELFRLWLRRQFVALGRVDDADALALHLLARSQGLAVLANVYRDRDFLDREVALLHQWLASIAG